MEMTSEALLVLVVVGVRPSLRELQRCLVSGFGFILSWGGVGVGGVGFGVWGKA